MPCAPHACAGRRALCLLALLGPTWVPNRCHPRCPTTPCILPFPAAVAGATVGAGFLALPAVTAEAGFAASATAITGFLLFSITTGLLVAEVNLNTLCELGASRGVSLRWG